MFFCAIAASPYEVRRVIICAMRLTAAAVESADANTALSQAAATASPAMSSTQDKPGDAGVAAVGAARWLSTEAVVVYASGPRMVAATATPTASSVITVRAPFATDLSARSSVMSRIKAKKPAAASVAHIGNSGDRQI